MARRSEIASRFNYERVTQRLMPWPMFLRRAALHFAVGLAGIVVAVMIGVVGYHLLGKLPWVDSFLNAAMILGGMGPVDKLETTPAKLFAAFYALFSGLVFIALMGVVLAPWAHRVLHRLHLKEDAEEEEDRATSASGRAGK